MEHGSSGHWLRHGLLPCTTMLLSLIQSNSNAIQAEAFGCVSMTSVFDLASPERKCIAYGPFYIAQAAINCFIDLVLLLFPLPLLVILNIDKKQRCE